MNAAQRLTIALLVVAAALPVTGRQASPQRDVPATTLQQTLAAAGTHSTLGGQITAAADGTPLQRVLVAVTVNGRAASRALSDADGRYEVEIPDGVPHSVLITRSGFVGVTLPRRSSAGSGRVTLDVSLAAAAVLEGRVSDPLGNQVVSVRVRLQQADAGPGSAEVITFTDDTGAFRVAGLAPGTYRVATAGRPEYLSGGDPMLQIDREARERRWPTSSEPATVELRAGDRRDVTLAHRDPTVILPYANAGGVVTGQVTDDSGEPASGLSVQLWRIEVLNGVPMADRSGPMRVTDERGQYRLFHVRPGRYALVVTDESSRTANSESSWLPVYYPGTLSPSSAVALDVVRGQELPGIDVAFTHSRGARVVGFATNAAGEPLKNTLSLVAPDLNAPLVPVARTASVGAEGAFEFDAVPPGAYVLRATSTVSHISTPMALSGVTPAVLLNAIAVPRDAEFAVQPVQVADADVGPIVFRTAPPATLKGRIVFEGMAPSATALELVAFTTDPKYDISGRVGDGAMSRAIIDALTWTFELTRVAGPTRLRLSAAPPHAWLKSADIDGTNLAESPFSFFSAKDSRDGMVVVVAGTAGTLTGTVAGGAEGAGVQVVAFSTTREQWNLGSPYVQWSWSDSTGRFSVPSLPPGEYWVVAIDSVQNELLRREAERADLFESLTADARRVTLTAGRTVTVSPRVKAMR